MTGGQGPGRRPRPEDEHPPMLVLGEDRPDVEDLTAEELRRQRDELEQRRRDMEQQLQAERVAAERELARRQREIDEAERDLQRAERRLRRRSDQVPEVSHRVSRARSRRGRRANALLAAAERRSGTPVPRMPRAVALAGAACALTVVGAITSIDPPADGDVAAFVDLDEARVAWQEAAVGLDGEVTRYLAGEDATRADGSLASAELATRAAALGGSDYGLRELREDMAPLLTEGGSNPTRVLNAWRPTRDSLVYAVSINEVRDARARLDNDRAWPTVLLLGGFVLTGALAYGLGRGHAWVAAGVAGVALVPAALLLGNQDRHLDVELAIEHHEEVLQDIRTVDDRLRMDLAALLGSRSLASYEGDDYWEGPRDLGPDSLTGAELDEEALAGYVDVRARIGELDIRSASTGQTAEIGQQLVAAGAHLLAGEHEELQAARDDVLGHTETDLDLAPYLAMSGAAAALPVLSLVPALARRRKVAP